MQRQRFVIECVRCGESRLDVLTEAEKRIINDGIGPVYRQCRQCEKTTGWIKGHGAPEFGMDYLQRGQLANGPAASQPVPSGQERMANQSELDFVNDLLQRLQTMGVSESLNRS